MVCVLNFYGLFYICLLLQITTQSYAITVVGCIHVCNRWWEPLKLIVLRCTVLMLLTCNRTPKCCDFSGTNYIKALQCQPLFSPFDRFAHFVRLHCVYRRLTLTLHKRNFYWNLSFVSGNSLNLNSVYAYICRNLSMIAYII